MTCESSKELILDLARHAAIPEPGRRAAEAHLAACPSCAAGFRRQRQLTGDLQKLAAEAQEWSAPAGIEEHLLAALAARAPVAPAEEAVTSARRWMYALATAAVLTLAVWGGVRAVEVFRVNAEATDPEAAKVEAAKVEAAKVETGEAVNRQTGRRGAAVATGRASNAATMASGASNNVAAAAAGSSDSVAPRSSDPGERASPVEFVRIPSAIGLPELESGTVRRVELPLAALPQYGVEISPDALRSSVEADILVGQDGQPRAIRLVGIADGAAQESRSRR